MAERREAWARKVGGRWELTDHARRELEAEGFDVGMDGIGNYLEPGSLESAAFDCAMYHGELTADGVPEGFCPAREAAADHIYSGMAKALKRKQSEQQSQP